MAAPTARVLALLELLQLGGTRTAADLAGRLGVDERTVRRYVRHLVDLDVPVRTERGRYGGFRLAPGYRMPPLMLTDDEAVAVVVGLAAAEHSGLVTGTSSALAKVRRVLPRHLADRVGVLLETVGFTTTRQPDTAPDTGRLALFAEAAGQRRAVAITYRSADGRAGDRTITPYGVVAHAGHWYVVAADSASREDRTFRLDRVQAANLAPAPKPLPGPAEHDSANREPADREPAARDLVKRGLGGQGLGERSLGERDPGERLLVQLATAPRRHLVSVRVRADAQHVKRRMPPGLATVEPLGSGDDEPVDPAVGGGGSGGGSGADDAGDCGRGGRDGNGDGGGGGGGDGDNGGGRGDGGGGGGGVVSSGGGPVGSGDGWVRVRLQVEELGWVPSLLAWIDRPFVVEEPAVLRGHVRALADRLLDSAGELP